ncbi:FAD-dependent oxidoreductase [Rhodanobacter sp. 115]|uniref:FAD-dependent oxidoreductase n=1 Tax=Rhodanobacter sp. FW021-MT20 TaxID=1162282 RepID=UPI000261007E|nr:NAD(P)/FAD-dependent oxidoreductase [Rhodanobacter sp. 115]EIL95838.1 FAD-binding monooxygenase [Rhodanobacter sp. 115]
MFIATSLNAQLARAQADHLRVLVVGAGVAGLTLAQALRAGGLHPVLVERAADHADDGYMLALMPLVEPVLRQAGVRDAYRARSVRFHRYVLHGRHGQRLREYAIDSLLSRYGEYRGIARGELMQALADEGAAVSYATTLRALRQTPEAAYVLLREGDSTHEAVFDAVVLADGLHSSSRELLLPAQQVSTFDCGWGGWVAWMDSDAAHADRGDEIWGSDFFVGVYPVRGRAGVFVGGHRDDTRAGPQAFVAHIRSQLRHVDDWLLRALESVAESGDTPYYWKLTDIRSATWAVQRTVLLGDAAAGFVPTAGIGAGMAMESAGVLARQLLATDRAGVPVALHDYERVQRPRVESAQDNSRALTKLMCRRSPALAAVRDVVARFVTLKAALGPIRKLLDSAPEM